MSITDHKHMSEGDVVRARREHRDARRHVEPLDRLRGGLRVDLDVREPAAGWNLPLLERCLGTPGVHVIDCPVDYSENDRILNVELRERALAV